MSATTEFEAALARSAEAVEDCLAGLLPDGDGHEERVMEAMRYSSLGGGKRIRPFLVMAGANMFNVSRERSERVGAAIEMVHTYSLIHDDLPAMDDDGLRRGQPTCHVKFDEATAILAGDALLTLAFEVVAGPDTHPNPDVRCDLALEMAKAAGAQGMVGGQMIDLVAEDHEFDVAEITRLQRMKTGALINFSCIAGGILGRATDHQMHILSAYAHDLGLAFQIVDDLLDVEGDTAVLGKTAGKDEAAGKATFVSLLGIERAREQARMLAGQAAAHLGPFDDKAANLCQLAEFVVNRRN